jgi:tRNA G26 N,N-dimethylase Trm1
MTTKDFKYKGINCQYTIHRIHPLLLAVYDDEEFLYWVYDDLNGSYKYKTEYSRVFLSECDESFPTNTTNFKTLEKIAKYGMKEIY